MAEEPKAHDETSPRIDGHAFEPEDLGKWWSLCKHCRLARAAHTTSVIDVREEMMKEHIATYGRVRYPKFKTPQEEREERLRNRGRVQIGYVGDDDDDE